MSFAFRITAVASLLATFAGCGTGPRLHPVTGLVQVDNLPANGALVVLSPENVQPDDPQWKDGYPRGFAGPDGRFTLMTLAPNDGAPAGKYIILVTWTGKPGDSEQEDTEVLPDVLGGQYASADKSTLRAEVKPGSNERPPLNLKSARLR